MSHLLRIMNSKPHKHMNTTIRTTNALSFNPFRNYIEIYLHFACFFFFFSSCFSSSSFAILLCFSLEYTVCSSYNIQQPLFSHSYCQITPERECMYILFQALFPFVSLFRLKKPLATCCVFIFDTHSHLLKWRFSCACPCVYIVKTEIYTVCCCNG